MNLHGARFTLIPHPEDGGDDLLRQPMTLQVLFALCHRVAWEERTITIGRQRVTLQPGQCIAGRNELAAALGLTPRQVRVQLEGLEKAHKVAKTAAKTYSIYTVIGWSDRPSDAAQNGQDNGQGKGQGCGQDNGQDRATNYHDQGQDEKDHSRGGAHARSDRTANPYRRAVQADAEVAARAAASKKRQAGADHDGDFNTVADVLAAVMPDTAEGNTFLDEHRLWKQTREPEPDPREAGP